MDFNVNATMDQYISDISDEDMEHEWFLCWVEEMEGGTTEKLPPLPYDHPIEWNEYGDNIPF